MVYDHPVALLIGRDGYERVVPIAVPPPAHVDVPIAQRLSINPPAAPPRHTEFPRRTFRLSPDRALRWWLVYNEGRCRTPEAGYVYYETK